VNMQVLGPICLVLALTFAPLANFTIHLYLSGALAFFFIFNFRFKGFIASCATLAIFSICAHLFAEVTHLYSALLESSLALSFLLIYLMKEEQILEKESLISNAKAKDNIAIHLEEEMIQKLDEKAKEHILSMEKIEHLNKEVQEIETEKNAIEILNDVLRRNNASSFEKEKLLQEETKTLLKTLDDALFLLDHAEVQRKIAEEESLELLNVASLDSQHLSTREDFLREEIEKLQTMISFLMKEPTRPHLSETIREAFSPKKKPPAGPTLEETLRESLSLKKKKKPIV
jgi:hypothetical protein